MIRVALVDDDAQYLAQLQGYLQRYAQETGLSLETVTFSDGDEIALHYKANYDIILMDVEMQFMDGMTAAEEIRTKDRDVVILFITNSPQYAIKGYAVDALDYLLKPVTYFAFSQRMNRAVARIRKQTDKSVMVPVHGGAHRLRVSQIYYLESQGHELLYHTEVGLLQATVSLNEVERTLDARMFSRCNRSYLVNLAHVDSIVDDNVRVHGDLLKLSRTRKKAFLDALNNYLNGESQP